MIARMLRLLLLALLTTAVTACQAPSCTEGEPSVARVVRAEGSHCSWFPTQGELCPQLTVELLKPAGALSESAQAVVETRIDALHASRVQPGSLVRVRTNQRGTVCLDHHALAEAAPTAE